MAATTTMTKLLIFACTAFTLFLGLSYYYYYGSRGRFSGFHFGGRGPGVKTTESSSSSAGNNGSSSGAVIIPPALLGTVYNASTDFVNAVGIHPPFWDCNGADNDSGDCQKNQNDSHSSHHSHQHGNENTYWGPCYPAHRPVNWKEQISFYRFEHEPHYAASKRTKGQEPQLPDMTDLSDLCRPGFIIIGAGKCGTSSLYHYITDHPRVLPAKEKQIHYFKYYSNRPMQWYLKHFPTARSFLASGALMTGEASPGYLPYPNVARLVQQRLPGPRIIAVGREPIDRAYSSYRYNYVNPTLELLRRGHNGVAKGLSDEEYIAAYLFSFEEMIRAELNQLRQCLAEPNGSAVMGARETYGMKTWARVEFERREKAGEPALVDLDGHCYGKPVSSEVLRIQWKELKTQYPDKIIPNQNVHLTQSFIGRGLYALPLEWWYANFDGSKDIHFLCTEELSDISGAPLNRLGDFLGLSGYNFSASVQQGAYNVGGHRGYDKEVSWETIEEEATANTTKKEIPLSEELHNELQEFLRPFNERLFALTGKRCDW